MTSLKARLAWVKLATLDNRDQIEELAKGIKKHSLEYEELCGEILGGLNQVVNLILWGHCE